MKTEKYNSHRVIMTLIITALVLFQSINLTTNVQATSLASTNADLSSEGRILDNFVDDLGTLDKKHAELGKKASLTRVEFEAHQRNANNLKNRVSAVQNALQDIIRKLKAAGQWDNFDALILAKIPDAKFQDFVRREGFKRILEAASTGLSADANEISNPLDSLRNKIRAQAQDSLFAPDKSPLALRAIPVAYNPTPAVFAVGFKCRLAFLRMGITSAFSKSGGASNRSGNAFDCHCLGSASACAAL